MSDDEVITHAAVLDYLSADVRRDLLLALPPEKRGWWTEAEIADQPGNWIEVSTLEDREPRFIPGRRSAP